MENPAFESPELSQLLNTQLVCKKCRSSFDFRKLMAKCPDCGGGLEYVFEGTYEGHSANRNDMWKNFALIPLADPQNIVALGVGDSKVIELPELSKFVNGAQLFLKMDSHKNPTGTFKDREASVILSRCQELGLDNVVFYSTGNTGRAYSHFAAELGLTSYFFMPKQCHYKNTSNIKKNPNNFIILVDDEYPKVGPYAKKFAQSNGLNIIAPLHERTECYATLAYEQFQQMPDCDYFAQTIASGMGPIGFFRGHKNLVKFGLEKAADMPRVICIQSRETNAMYRAYSEGLKKMPDDWVGSQPEDLFEPTLNSTNPVNNYPDLLAMLEEANGLITDVGPTEVNEASTYFIEALERRGITYRTNLEKSALIGFAGLVRLSQEGNFRPGERIMLLSTGRGDTPSSSLIKPDAIIDPDLQDPEILKQELDKIL